MNKKYNSLDLLKFILAIFVIAIHTDPLIENKYPFYDLFLSMAVPCFFIISSFLIFQRENNIESIKKHLIKIIKLYLIWTIIYMPITLYYYINSDNSFIVCLIQFLRNFIFIGEQYYSWPLWYLLATIYSLIIVLVFNKLNIKDLYLYILAIVLFILGMLIDYVIGNIDNYSGSMFKMFHVIKHLFGSGRMFYSLLYICIGKFITKLRYNKFKLLLIIGLIVLLPVNYYIDFIGLKVLFYVVVFMSFLILNLKDRKIYYFFRKSSTVMYFTHMIFFFIYSLIVGFDNCSGIKGFIVTLMCSLLLSTLIFVLDTRYKNNKVIRFIF